MRRPQNLTGRIFAVVAASIALYALLALLTGWRDFRQQLAEFPLRYLLPLLLLSLANYGLRYWRWEIYLRCLEIGIPRSQSLALFFAAFVMVITPGKLGEAFKAGILWERYGISLGKGLPVVLAERIFDFLALFCLASLGLLFWSGPATGVTTGLLTLAFVPLFVVLLRSARVRAWLLEKLRLASAFQRMHIGIAEGMQSLASLLGTRMAIQSLLLSLVAWTSECFSLWLVCRGAASSLPLLECAFIYAAGTLVGSLTFLPGGLGGTEGTIIWLLTSRGITGGAAVTITLLVRAATLWLAVVLGLVVFVAVRRAILSPPQNADPQA